MQEIADEAGINKALLHYYFRSKDKLFDLILLDSFKDFFPKAAALMLSSMPLSEKIPVLVKEYIGLLYKNPHLPIFIMHELSRNPQRIVNLVTSLGVQPLFLLKQIEKETEEGLIRPYPPEQLLVNILSMIIFPFAGRPIIQGIIFDNDEKSFDAFLQERADQVITFIINALKP
jgi:AcrR family transcriptional regulator